MTQIFCLPQRTGLLLPEPRLCLAAPQPRFQHSPQTALLVCAAHRIVPPVGQPPAPSLLLPRGTFTLALGACRAAKLEQHQQAIGSGEFSPRQHQQSAIRSTSATATPIPNLHHIVQIHHQIASPPSGPRIEHTHILQTRFFSLHYYLAHRHPALPRASKQWPAERASPQAARAPAARLRA